MVHLLFGVLVVTVMLGFVTFDFSVPEGEALPDEIKNLDGAEINVYKDRKRDLRSGAKFENDGNKEVKTHEGGVAEIVGTVRSCSTCCN